jgi:hypothetical protein
LHSRGNLVPVPTMVRDANGEAVYGLNAQDFVIEDDGIEQSIHFDETCDAQPLSILIAVQSAKHTASSAEGWNLRYVGSSARPSEQ